MKHTPGPWTINTWPQANSDITIGAPGTALIARVPLRDVSINAQKGNARLIAAAPDLLAAVSNLVDQIGMLTNLLDGAADSVDTEIVDGAIALLAQVEGN